MLRKYSMLVLMLFSIPWHAFSHAGHGVLHGHEPGHYLFSSEHAVFIMLGVILIAALLTRKIWSIQRGK